MLSMNSPPPPPPYSAKHTIIASVNKNMPILKPTSLPMDPVEGTRISSGLNITFPSPTSPRATNFSQPRRSPVPYTLQPHLDKRQQTLSMSPSDTLQQSSGHQQVLQVYSNRRPPIDGMGSVSIHRLPSGQPLQPDLNMGQCAECQKRITNSESACQALGCIYHNDCFICYCCRRTLRGKIFYKDQDKIYCEDDYLYCGFQRMAEKCAACGHIISEKILQTMGKAYHPGCFRCYVCTKCLDEAPFTVDKEGRFYCLPDYHLVTAPICAACAKPILPEEGSEDVVRVIAQNKSFHIDCYRCEDCKVQLADEADRRWYPLVETLEGSGISEVTRTHLLCLQCHLSRIGATPASGQTLMNVGDTQQPIRRGSNGGDMSSSPLTLLGGTPRIYSPTPTSYSIAPISKSPYSSSAAAAATATTAVATLRRPKYNT